MDRRSPLFKPLPFDWPKKTTEVIKGIGPGSGGRRENIPQLAARIRRLFDATRIQDYAGLLPSDLACLPYVLWMADRDFLDVDHPILLRRYWDEILPSAIQSDAAQHGLWLIPLLHTYVNQFSPDDPRFKAFAERLQKILTRSQHPLAMAWSLWHADCNALLPSQAGLALARFFFLTGQGELRERIAGSPLGLDQMNTPFGHSILEAGLALATDVRRDEQVALRMLNWLELASLDVVAIERWRVPVAEALLTPWSGIKTPAQVSRKTYAYFEQRYGVPPDARVGQLLSGHETPWADVSARALDVMRYWQLGDQIRLFMRLIRDTADDTWAYRERFWMAYYDAGVVSQVRLILGPEAKALARRPEFKSLAGKFAVMDGSSTANQSVIIITIGDLVLVEGSHNRSLRAFLENEQPEQAAYLRSVHRITSDRLKVESLDFHEDQGNRDGKAIRKMLYHMRSQEGWWQRKARNLIKRYTTVALPDWEILL